MLYNNLRFPPTADCTADCNVVQVVTAPADGGETIAGRRAWARSLFKVGLAGKARMVPASLSLWVLDGGEEFWKIP